MLGLGAGAGCVVAGEAWIPIPGWFGYEVSDYVAAEDSDYEL